jgi:hypothetical protein
MSTMSIAHETGSLAPGTWIDDCQVCTDLCSEFPETTLVVKTGGDRFTLLAGNVHKADQLAAERGTYVREIWVRR